jgi:hypothetical protein
MGATDLHIRIPEWLAQRLREAANEDARSLNSMITVALREWWESRSRQDAAR